MKSVPTNLPFPLLYGSVDLTLTSELISNLISYKPIFLFQSVIVVRAGAFGKTALGRPAVVVDAMGAGDVGAASG